MVALLVAISVMAIMMTAAMPAWHTMVQREKEAELVFRGEQIARAIGLYQRRFANAPAPSVDFLVEQRFLRKKYKDPIANDDFQVLTSGTNQQPGQIQGRAQGAAPATQTIQTILGRGQGSGSQQTTGRAGAAGSAQGSFGSTATGGVVGVTSKSPLKSLRLYNGQDVYNQWVFMPVAQAARAGGPGGPAGGRGADGRGAGAGGGGRGQGGTPQGRGGTPQGQRGAPQGQGGRGGFELTPPARGRF
jgi:type II secretory pathway pseudopilin PulG